MANIKWSAIGVTDASGKSGGSIFAKSKAGSYIKNFAKPSNTNSKAQRKARSNFGGVSNLWRTLTVEEAQAWDNIANEYPQTNAFGDTFFLSGKALFQQLNTNRGIANLPPLRLPLPPSFVPKPTHQSSAAFLVSGTTVGALAFRVNFSPAASGYLIYEATRRFPRGRKPINSDYLIYLTAQITSTTQANIVMLQPFKDKFGNFLNAGDIVYFRVYLIHPNGERGMPLEFSLTAS